MLVRQGALSLHYWTGLEIEKLPVSKMESALSEHLR
jgi:shikimate 5-dehydrogenase